jgi:arginine:ornithine antiporter/lysine permease
VAAVWLTNILVQTFLILTLFAQEAFNLALDMTSAKTLIPYVLVAGYALKLAVTRETYESDSRARNKDLVWAAIATLYTIFMLVAGGLKFVLLSFIIFAPGTLLFIFARREQGRTLFTPVEWALFAIVLAGAAYGVYALATGLIAI